MSRKQMDDEELRAVSEEIVAEELRAVSEETVSEETVSGETMLREKPFDPEIDEKVMFCPYDGNDHIVTIISKPENGTTKWLTSEGPINACYLKQINPEQGDC